VGEGRTGVLVAGGDGGVGVVVGDGAAVALPAGLRIVKRPLIVSTRSGSPSMSAIPAFEATRAMRAPGGASGSTVKSSVRTGPEPGVIVALPKLKSNAVITPVSDWPASAARP
jgi:hypothetical protein